MGKQANTKQTKFTRQFGLIILRIRRKGEDSLWISHLNMICNQRLISPYIITSKSNFKVMRMRGNDHQQKKLLIAKQTFLVSTSGNV